MWTLETSLIQLQKFSPFLTHFYLVMIFTIVFFLNLKKVRVRGGQGLPGRVLNIALSIQVKLMTKYMVPF